MARQVFSLKIHKPTEDTYPSPTTGGPSPYPLPFVGGTSGDGGGAIIFLNPMCSVHLCSSVKERKVLPE